jgi:hypothetical protein
MAVRGGTTAAAGGVGLLKSLAHLDIQGLDAYDDFAQS